MGVSVRVSFVCVKIYITSFYERDNGKCFGLEVGNKGCALYLSES